MATSATLVVTGAKILTPFQVAQALKETLKPFVATYLWPIKHSVNVMVMDSSQALCADFKVNSTQASTGDKSSVLNRSLYVFYDCASDNPQFGSDQLLLSVGDWGDADAILLAVGKRLAEMTGPESMLYMKKPLWDSKEPVMVAR